MIVWNNNPDRFFEHPTATVVNCNKDCGLYTRFVAGVLAQNNCLLIQDDDVLLPCQSIKQLYRLWSDDKYKLHGVFGRAPKPDNTYAKTIDRQDARCPIVLTRVLMTERSHVLSFFNWERHFRLLQVKSQPEGNGEDIIFSYVAAHRNNSTQHYVHNLAVTELPAPDAIHKRDWNAHCKHRTAIMQACQRILQ
jgi:hypothetical protein